MISIPCLITVTLFTGPTIGPWGSIKLYRIELTRPPSVGRQPGSHSRTCSSQTPDTALGRSLEKIQDKENISLVVAPFERLDVTENRAIYLQCNSTLDIRYYSTLLISQGGHIIAPVNTDITNKYTIKTQQGHTGIPSITSMNIKSVCVKKDQRKHYALDLAKINMSAIAL